MPSRWAPAEKKLHCMRAAKASGVPPARLYELVRVIESYILLDEDEEARYAAMVRDDEEVHKMVITWEDALAHATDEGKIENARDYIVRVLKRRLQDVPAFIIEKLNAIDDTERLDAILDQALDVSSVDELTLDS